MPPFGGTQASKRVAGPTTLRTIRRVKKQPTQIVRGLGLAAAATLLLTGCGSKEYPALRVSGWQEIHASSDKVLIKTLQQWTEAARGAAYSATYLVHAENPEEASEVTVERHGGITHVTLTGQVIGSSGERVGSSEHPVDVYAADWTDGNYFGRTVLCADDERDVRRCVEITPLLVGIPAEGFEEALPDNVLGVNARLAASALDIGIHDTGVYKAITEMMDRPVEIHTTDDENRSITLTRKDRVVITAKQQVGRLGEAECIGWLDSELDLHYENTLSGWCRYGQVIASYPRVDDVLLSLRRDPGALRPDRNIEVIPEWSTMNEYGVYYAQQKKVATPEMLAALREPVRW